MHWFFDELEWYRKHINDYKSQELHRFFDTHDEAAKTDLEQRLDNKDTVKNEFHKIREGAEKCSLEFTVNLRLHYQFVTNWMHKVLYIVIGYKNYDAQDFSAILEPCAERENTCYFEYMWKTQFQKSLKTDCDFTEVFMKDSKDLRKGTDKD